MPNNYDEVVEQNRKNLTKAQIAALAKAAQEYGIMNAGNRAGALASLRDQYNAGYRGLQNMGLAGGMEAQARSGEVPRLGAQLQTPFDQYNRKLMEVENKQLSALGSAFADSTKKARAAAAKAKAEAEAAAAAWAAKQKRTAEYEDPRMVYGPKGDKRVTFDKQNADLSAALAVAEIDPRMAKFQNPNFQTAKAGYAGAAGYTSAIMQKQRADAFNERRYAEYEDPRLSNPNFLAERRKERSAALAAAEIDPRTAMFQDPNFQTAKAGYAGSMRRYQAAYQDPAVVARKNYEAKNAVVRNMFNAKRSGEVSDDEYRAAVADRDIAKMHMERPDIPIFAEIDHEAAGANLERARNDYDSVRNASGWKPQPSVDEMHTRYRVQYNHYKGLLSVLDDPNATKADKDRARTSIESSSMTVDEARKFVNKYETYSPAEEPEDVRQARANAEMADLAYNHPDVYKALYYKEVMTPEMRAKYPEITAWVDDTIARYNMESLGIKVPTMTRPEYAHAEANAEDIMGLLNEYDAYDNRKGKEAERDAAADLLMKRYHMTVDQAWDFIDNMRNQRDVWSEYDYYYAGARAQVEHNGEKPTQPVNEGENDVTYRAVNGLSRTAGYDVSLTGVRGDDGHMAEFMTPEQRDAYNAIYERDGIAAANEYYKAITPYLNIQRAAEDEAYYKKFAREHPFLADVRSVGANLLWNIPAAAENVGTGVVGMFTKDRPYYDVNSDFSFRSGRADAIRGQRSFDILNDMSNPEPVRQMQNFAYNTGMSIADSAAIMGLAYLGAPEWVTALFFGSSAGNQAYKDARARGATQDQALALGIANGIFEALFEEVSLDKVMNMDHTGRAALIKNLLTQMFVEGSEEAFTGIADTLADVLIMGDKSAYKQNIANYVAAGKSQNEAEWLAFLDQVKETGMDALGGMVSGGVFALGGAAIHDVRAVNHGDMMLEDRGLNDRVTRMAELFGGKALEMLEKYQADPNARNAGNLYMVVNETMNELFGRTEKPDVDKIAPVDESAIIDRATAASALLSGDRMSVTTAENIIGVLGNEYLSAKGMNVSSPAAFANDYNARLAKYGIKSYGETVAKSFKFKTDTLEGFRNRKADQAYRAANPSYAGGSITGKALESRMANRQRVETAAVLNTAENNAAARVWQNPNMGYTTNADGSRFMNMPGNMTAVAMAEYSRKSFKAQTTAAMDGVTLELAGMEARKGLTDTQVFAEAKKAMTKEAAQKLDVFMKLAKSLSMPMVIRDVVAGTSGYVHDGKLYVTLSGQQSIPKVVAHELTHFMKDHALQKYNALRTHLIAEVGNTKFNELMQEKAKSYGLDLDTEAGRIEADDEVCAELCERMLSNPDSLERFVERNTDAAITLKDRLLKLLNAIKAALKDPANRNFGRSHSDLIKQEQTVEAWLDGINEAIKNANERAKTTEGRIAQVAGVTTSDQESLIRDIKKASETAAKAKQESAAPVRTAEKATTESKTTEKTTAETEPVKAATEADTESKKPAEAAKPAAKPRRYVRVDSTVSDRQGTTFEGGRAPRGMTDLTYKIQNATNFGSGLVTGSMSDYASFGYTSYFGNLDGDAYGYSKSTWRNAGGRAIRDSQAAVSSASDLKQGDAFVNDVLQYNFLSSEELGKANSMTEAEITDRDAAEVDVASVLSADQIAAAETVAGMLAKGSEVVIQLPVTDNFDQLARATLKAVFEAMPANKRTGVSFATGLTSADISRKGGDVSLIITDKSQQQTGDGKQWTDLSRDSAADAAFETDVDQAFAKHSVDIIEYDMAGYRQDLVSSGVMSEAEIDDLFSTMMGAVKYIKLHREILDFGFRLSEEAQNDPELAEKEIKAAKEGRAYLPYKQNADPHYKLALDFSTLCKKRILLQMIQERLQGKLGRALSALETIAVRREIQKLQKNGVNVEVACALCYVEAARLKSPKVINEFLGVGLSAEERAKNVEAEMKNYFAQKDKAIAKTIEAAQKRWKVEQLGTDWRGTDKKGRTITAEKATKDHLKAFGGQALVDAFNAFSKSERTGQRVGDALNTNQRDVINEAKRLVQQSPDTFLSAESLAQLKKDNPDIFYAFTNKVRSATRSKALETDTFYSRGDISMVEEAIVRTANKESGFRHQSWSDFMPIHLLDTMASIIEMSQRDAKMHAYTKVPEMVRLLGKTGMMLNLSLIPKGETGLNTDGTLAWDSVEGMDWDVMKKLRNDFADTVGNIAIGISDEQIRQLLASDDIDYVIPYHVSGMNKTLRSHMGIHTWLDFTSSQNESERDGKAPSGRTWKEEHKARKMKPPALEAWFKEKDAKAAGKNGVAYMQKAAQDYLDICAMDGWVPKFSQYLDYDAKANKYTVKPGYENYWKMLTDRKMVNQKTGEVIIQQAVKPKFDNATVMDILRSEAEDPTAIRNAAAADEIAGELGKTWRGDKENANLKSYKAELNAFREASAVMAADRVKEDVQRRLAETRNSLDTDYMFASGGQGRGYDGYSMSNNARAAYENGQMPMSKWTKTSIVDAVRAISKEKADLIKDVNVDTLRQHVLEMVGWHHTSSMYNKTDFYQIDEDVVDKLTADMVSSWERISSKPTVKDAFRGDISYIEWGGTKNHPKANHKQLTNVNIQEKGSFYIVTDDQGNVLLKKKVGSNGTEVKNYEREALLQKIRREQEERRIMNSTEEANLLYAEFKKDGMEFSSSGNVYKRGRKPDRIDYAMGVEKFFKNGEKRLATNYNGGYFVETWNGKEWIPELASIKDQQDIRNSIDEEFVDTVNKTASTTRYTADTEKSERLPAYKPQGKAPRVREVMVPERAKNGDRVSDFVRSFLESDKASDEIVAELQDKIENGEWGSYTQLSNEEAMDRAKGYIARKQFTEAQSDFHDMVASGKYNVHTRALGLQLLTEAANRGDKASVLDIAADLRQLATDAGQSLQIFSVLKELSGVGAAWYMQKEIDRLNNQYADEIASGKMNEITVAAELMQQLMQASTQAEVEAAEDAIAEQVADQLPLTWKSRITNWRYLSMLGNPTTHFRNLTGNVFMAGMNAVKDVVATGIERVAVKPEDRAHAVLTRADRNTWKDFASASFQEQEKNLRGSGKNGFGSFIQRHMRAFDTKWLNAISQGSKTGKNAPTKNGVMGMLEVMKKNGVMGMLEVEDTWFLKPAYQNALMQYMKAQGYTLQDGVAGKVVNGKFTEITTAQMSKAIDWASQQAWKATFRDASALASLLNKASNLNPVAHVLVEGIMPFKKTPVNIAKRGIEYSPIGVVMGAVQMVRDVRKGKMTAAQAIDNIASGVVGTSLMVIGMFMAKAGLLRAGGDDDKKKSTYLLDTGDQTYSLKFGNVSIGISALAPAAIPLLMGAALWDAMNRDGEDEWDISAITETIAGTLDPFMEMSVVSSLNSALKNYNKNGIGGTLGNTILTALQSYGGQMLPTFVGKVGQYIDPITRTTKSSAASPIGGTWDYYGRSLMKKIPGVEALLEPDVNVWGRTTKKSGLAAWALDFANRFILPVNVKIANRDAVDDELIRLVESTGNISILPSDGDKYFTVDGKKYPMTAAQYTEFSKDRGQASYAAMKEVMNSPAYQKATDAERADMLSNALKMAQKHVNTVWKEKLGALDTAKAPANTEAPAQPTGAKEIQGDYSDPALYQIAAKYPNAYDKAAKAKSRGIDPTTFLELYEKMDTYIGEGRGSYMRSEIMASNLTPEQKELMDDLLISDKGRNPDYSSPTWFEVSMLGKSAYDEAKAGEKIGLKPEIYLEAYTKCKEIDAAKLGKDRKPTILRYLDSLNISAPVYDYLLLAVFGIKSR